MSQKINKEVAQRVVLYTRAGCHLCNDAEQMLWQHGVMPEVVDIDDDPELRERFNTTVPVVEIAGAIRFRGRVDSLLLQRILRHEGLL